jgi:hypothetical protein
VGDHPHFGCPANDHRLEAHRGDGGFLSAEGEKVLFELLGGVLEIIPGRIAGGSLNDKSPKAC